MSQARFHPELTPRIEEGDALRGRLGKRYRAAPGLLAAVNVALTLERPLLLTGEPGCGKTDFAWAAASALGAALDQPKDDRKPLECYVRSDSRARDLLYVQDSVSRFADAQHGNQERARDPRRYIELQPLGRGLADRQRRVVLIDEIDKAPKDLPNDLLRELNQISFEISEIPGDQRFEDSVTSHSIPLERVMERPRDAHGEPLPAPLVIITSNVERQLPDAFLRRCIFWHIEFPEALLPAILSDHVKEADVAGDFLDRTIAVFLALREVPGLTKKPAVAELIDWAGALLTIFDPRDSVPRLRAFSDRLADAPTRALPWPELPGLACLVKLREDLDTLRPKEAT